VHALRHLRQAVQAGRGSAARGSVARLRFSLVGQGKRAQGEDLVDLGRVNSSPVLGGDARWS
jgi:hypothetical protein